MKRRIALALAAVVVAASSLMGQTVPAGAEVNPYTTEGTHRVNGRDWRTTCEPYSQTKRCRTEIRATQVSEVNGAFVAKTDWVFNNLTYLPALRSLWKGNNLARSNQWSAVDGRRWYTECDTPVTGRDGCRSYTESRVIERIQKNGVWSHAWVTRFVFNNIVMFSASATPPKAPPTVAMPDAELRACINVGLRKPIGSAIPLTVAEGIMDLSCPDGRISDLRGLEKFPNLSYLDLSYNQISDLTPLKGLGNLEFLALHNNGITDVGPLASVTGLAVLDLSDNSITTPAALKSLTGLEYLSLGMNRITDLAPLATLGNLTILEAAGNEIANLGNLSGLTSLIYLDVSSNSLTNAKGLASLPSIEALSLSGNGITDLRPLAGLRTLTGLDAAGNGITSLASLSSSTGLEMLFLENNDIIDVAPLQGLTNLTVLSLNGNAVANVTPLSRLVTLESLALASNNIAVVAPLATLPNLQELFLWDNPVLDKGSLQPLLERGCEVYFDEPGWLGLGDSLGQASWAEALGGLGVTATS